MVQVGVVTRLCDLSVVWPVAVSQILSGPYLDSYAAEPIRPLASGIGGTQELKTLSNSMVHIRSRASFDVLDRSTLSGEHVLP